MAENFNKSNASLIMLTQSAINHPYAATVYSLAKLVAKLSGAKIMSATPGANSAGAWMAGAVPHRIAAGMSVDKPGKNAASMIAERSRGFLLMGVEPELDCNNPSEALAAMQDAEFVVALSAYRNENMLDYADVILPTSVFTESSGTFVNVEGNWQRFHGCVKSFEESRPGWKVLRVLGNYLDLTDFEYATSEEVHDEVAALCKQNEGLDLDGWFYPSTVEIPSQIRRVGTCSSYYIDSTVRRATPLHESASNKPLQIRLHPDLGNQYNMRNSKLATVVQGGGELTCQVMLDDKISPNTVVLASGHKETSVLGEAYGVVQLK